MLPNLVATQYNLFQQIFGTSLVSEIFNGILVVIILYIVVHYILSPIALIVLGILDFRHLRDRQLVFLELSPSTGSDKAIIGMTQLVIGIHGFLSLGSYKDRLLMRKHIISPEVVSTRAKGIRFIVPLSPGDVALFKQLVISYYPNVKIREVKDYLSSEVLKSNCQILEFKQTNHFAYQLAKQDKLNQHDPIAYITGSMTKPLPDEIIALQLVMSPASSREITKVRRELLRGQDASLYRRIWHYPFIILWKMFRFFLFFINIIFWLIGGMSPSSKNKKRNGISPGTSHVIGSLNSKLDESLFNVDMRALVVGADNNDRVKGLVNSLYQFNVPGYQGLVVRKNYFGDKMSQFRIASFRNRLPAMLTRNSAVLSASEVASLYHFPYGQESQTEDMVKSYNKILPAPITLKRASDNNELNVKFGVNRYHGSDTAIGLTKAERERHVYILGGTGNGKTTLLQSAIIDDIQAGKGVAVIDPHGDLAETLLKYIPKERIKDVIYFNPRDIGHPIGLNLLEQPEGLSEDELLLEQDFITEAVVSIFRKIFSNDEHGGHRIEHFLRSAIHTTFTIPDATLFTIYKLLTNTAFRKSIVSKLTDEELKDFWEGEFNTAGDYQKVKMSGGVNAKLGRFQRSVVSRRILEQPKSTIDFDDIIQTKKILICNFSKGHIGEDTSTLLGISVLAKLQLASLRRARLGENKRTPFYLYVDEFQNFATISFVQLLSEARKYKLFLTMAEQSTAQQEEKRLVDIILANVGTVICFRSGSPQDEKLLLPIFKPFIENGDIANLPAYNFYMRIRAVENIEPMSGETVLLEDSGSEEIARKVIESSIDKYTKLYVKPVEKVVINASAEKYRVNNRNKSNSVVFKSPSGKNKKAISKK